jgi:hypothetical protein
MPPHEGRELELMLAGKKPLSMFVVDDPDPGLEFFPEEDFDRAISEGKLVKHVVTEWLRDGRGPDCQLRKVFYALPGEEWRIKAYLLVWEIYLTLVPGWRPDLERVIGALLGYERESTEQFLARLGFIRPEGG